jgi:hypothetical protein
LEEHRLHGVDVGVGADDDGDDGAFLLLLLLKELVGSLHFSALCAGAEGLCFKVWQW